jgi:hypothetical protein
MPGTAACGRSAPRIAAGGTFGRAGALFGAGALCGFFAGTRLCHGIAFPSLAFSKNDMHTVYNNTACIYRRIRTYDFYFITIEKPCKVKCCLKNVKCRYKKEIPALRDGRGFTRKEEKNT